MSSAGPARVVVDVVPALVLSAVAAHEELYDHVSPTTWVVAQLVIWLLLLRRRAPEAVLAGTLVLAVAQWLVSGLSVAHLAVLVALHAVAWRRPLPRALAAALVVEVAAVAAALSFAPTGSANDGVVLLSGLTMSALLLGTTQHTQLRYLEALEDRAEQLERDRAQRAELAAAAERTRIARDVHDVVAHSVSVMIALSEGAAATPDGGRARSTMRQVAATGRGALDDLRRVLSVLHADGDQPAGRRPLEGLAALSADVGRAGLTVDVDVDPEAYALDEGVQGALFRIVQESLTNTLKHANGATCSVVRLAVGDDDVALDVRDDGRHVAAPAVPPGASSGRGVRGMAERAELCGGELTAFSTDDGWLVSCRLPRASPAPEVVA